MPNRDLKVTLLGEDKTKGAFKSASDGAGKLSSSFTGLLKVAGAFAAAGGITSFLSSSISEARESQKVAAQTTQVIKSTGAAAKISAGQVGDLATAISNKTGIDDEAIQSGANLLLTFTNVRNEVGKGNDIFNQATQTMTDMAAALGTDASGSAIQLGKALNDPIKGITALQRVGVSFTEDQRKQIKSLVEHNDTLSAQKIILGELAKEFGGSAAAQATAGEKAAVAYGNLKEAVGTALLPVLDRLMTFVTDTVIPKLYDMGHFLSDKLGPLIKTGLSAVPRVIDGAAGAVKTVAAKFSAAFGGLQPAVTGAMSKASTAVAQAFTNVRADLGPFLADLQAKVTAFGQPLIDAMRTALSTGDYGPLGEAVGRALAQALTASANAVGAITAALGHVLGSVDFPALGVELGKQAPAVLLGLAIGIASFDPMPVLSVLKDNWFEVIIGILSVAFAPARVIGKLGEILARIPFVGSLLKWFLDALVTVSKGLVDKVAQVIGATAHAFVDGFVNRVAPDAATAINDFGLKAIMWLGVVGGKILEVVRALPGNIGAAIITGFEYVGRVVGDLIGLILRPFVDLGARFARFGLDLIGGLLRGILSKIGAVVDFLGGIDGLIVKAVGNLGNTLAGAGQAVINGFIDGIEAGFRRVKDTLGRLTSMLPDWKGPADRDATLLYGAGQLVMGGFEAGLRDSFGSIRRALTDATDLVGLGVGGSAYVGARLAATAASAPAEMPLRSTDRTAQLLAEQNDLLREQNRILQAMPRSYQMGVRQGLGVLDG